MPFERFSGEIKQTHTMEEKRSQSDSIGSEAEDTLCEKPIKKCKITETIARIRSTS